MKRPPSLGAYLQVASFVLVMMAIGLQLLAEHVFYGMGSGFSRASSSFAIWPVTVVPSLAVAFLGSLPKGRRAAVRSLGYALTGHALAASYIWLFLSTPYDDWVGNPNFWLDQNPQIAGGLLAVGDAALFLFLIATGRLPGKIARR
ncbi:hypothetical protein D3C86_1359780 [compost metagenome]